MRSKLSILLVLVTVAAVGAVAVTAYATANQSTHQVAWGGGEND